MERSPKIRDRTVERTGSESPPASDKLDELERRARELYKTGTAAVVPPVTSEFPVQVTLPGLRAEFKPNRLKMILPWLLAAAVSSGLTGWIAGQWSGLREGVTELRAVQAVQREQAEQIKALEALSRSHASRITNLEGQAPMVVIGK